MTRKSANRLRQDSARPDRKSSCLCGSGKLFYQCCLATYGASRGGGSPQKLFNRGEIEAALSLARANITRYSIWHLQHTVPLMRASPQDGERLMALDLAALSEMVDLLLSLSQRSKRIDKFEVVLERLRRNINDPRWQRKITYFQAFAFDCQGDSPRALGELLKLAPFDDETDPDILHFYMDVAGRTLSFSERQSLIDRILVVSNKAVDRLQYKCIRAIDYVMINDMEAGKRHLDEAITNYRLERAPSDEDIYARMRYGSAVVLQAQLFENVGAASESILILQDLLDDESKMTAEGTASVHREFGEIYRSKGDFDLAKEHFTKAFQIQPYAIYQVFLASCLISKEEYGAAKDILEIVEREELSVSEAVDFAFTYAQLARSSNTFSASEKALTLLKDLSIEVPYFLQIRDGMVISLLEQKTIGAVTNDKGVWARISSVAQFLSLKPNFMGVGVDFNKMIDTAAATPEKKKKP
jgi:tetratricopeptide (TPR) repeat protein